MPVCTLTLVHEAVNRMLARQCAVGWAAAPALWSSSSSGQLSSCLNSGMSDVFSSISSNGRPGEGQRRGDASQGSPLASGFDTSCRRGFSSSAAASSAAAGPSGLDILAAMLSPTLLGAQVWEVGHSLTGLPWWGSILATTFAARTLLLPLSLKGRSASSNLLLLDTALAQVGRDGMQAHMQGSMFLAVTCN